MSEIIDHGYDIPEKHGGGTKENVDRLEAFIEDLSQEQPWMNHFQLVRTARETLFPEE